MAEPNIFVSCRNSTDPDPPDTEAVSVTACPSTARLGDTASEVVVAKTIKVGSPTVFVMPPYDTDAVLVTVEGVRFAAATTVKVIGL